MKKIEDAIIDAKDALPDITPNPPGFKQQSSVHDLKARLEWGEPAFTILDVRERNTFNDGHILGAMSMPADELVERAQGALQPTRDIYIYAETDEQAAQAANQLRAANFYNVAELKGGFPAWKAIGGPTEGVIESRTPPGRNDYNVVDAVKTQAENQKKGSKL